MDAVALVSVVTSGLLGLLGLGATIRNSTKDRGLAMALAREEREAAFELAREERRQGSRADAYVDQLLVVQQMGQWAQSVIPMMDSEPPQPDPPMPDLAVQFAARAKVAAHGSAAVLAAIEEWQESLRGVSSKVWDVKFRRDYKDNHPRNFGERLSQSELELYDVGSAMIEVHKARPVEAAARAKLEETINAELNG